jgi:hypothetical protein
MRRRSSGLRRESSLSALDARHSRHADVEHREVDLFVESSFDRLGAVAGFCDDLQIGLGVEDEAEPAPDDGVVVGEQYARACARVHRGSVTGRDSETSVPPPGAFAIDSSAPIMSARSRMPRIPLPGCSPSMPRP